MLRERHGALQWNSGARPSPHRDRLRHYPLGGRVISPTVKTSSRDGRRAGRQPCPMPAPTGVALVTAKEEDDVTDTGAATATARPGRDLAARSRSCHGCGGQAAAAGWVPITGTGDAAWCACLSGPGRITGQAATRPGSIWSSASFRRVGTGCGCTSRSCMQGPRFPIAGGTQVTLRSLSEPGEFARIAAPVIERGHETRR